MLNLTADFFPCRSMNGKLVSQEEQITEYTERIAAVEEELNRVSLLNLLCILGLSLQT